jgi:hypothetical protein
MFGASGRELRGEAVRQGALTDKLAERRRRERPSRAGQDPLMGELGGNRPKGETTLPEPENRTQSRLPEPVNENETESS